MSAAELLIFVWNPFQVFVPNDMKDDKYWSRRQKNNVAAKRSRDARRIKENQIALRASFLEKENDTLRDEVASVRSENKALQARIEALEKMAAKVSPSDSWRVTWWTVRCIKEMLLYKIGMVWVFRYRIVYGFLATKLALWPFCWYGLT